MNKSILTAVILLLIGFSAKAQFYAGGVIVKINPHYLDYSIIDDKNIINSEFHHFLNHEGIKFLEQRGQYELLSKEMRKVFPFLTTNDTTSVGRLGNTIKMPSFWSVFAFDTQLNSNEVSRQMEELSPFVVYAHPNFMLEVQSAPNDEYYGRQHSLDSIGYPDAHINVQDVWNIETGKPHIKVGVYDTGLDSSQADLDVLTGGQYGKSDAIVDGDLILDRAWGTDQWGHGTSVAGIIGAKRNNNIGIAGIAGGDGSDTTGVSIIDFKVLPFAQAYVEGCAAAIVDGARSPYTYYDWSGNPLWEDSDEHLAHVGYGIHIANHSYSFKTNVLTTDDGQPGGNRDDEDPTDSTDVPDPQPTEGVGEDCDLCIEALIFSNANNVANVVARGNHFYHGEHVYEYGFDHMFPQKVEDNMIISVGGTSADGNRWTVGNNSATESTWSSMLGDGIDLSAPATNSIVHSLQSNQDVAWLANDDYSPDTLTVPFGGTSAAAPHVSGALALLLSYYNKPCYSNYNLAPEDMEYLLQLTATDIHSVGYDDSSGWGRLNVEHLFAAVEKPYYQIVHPPSEMPIDTPMVVLEDTILFRGNALVEFGPFGEHAFASEISVEDNFYYWVERYKVTAQYDFSAYVLTPETEILDVWARANTSTFGKYQEDGIWEPGKESVVIFIDDVPVSFFPDPFEIELDAKVESVVGNIVTISGYGYHFIEEYPTETPLDIWYPVYPTDAKFEYSVYMRDLVNGLGGTPIGFDFLCDSTIVLMDTTLNIKENIIEDLNIFPNPYKENITFRSGSPMSHVAIFDVQGNIVFENKINNSLEYRVNLAKLAKGSYFAKVTFANGKFVNRKITKL